jgi:hypothetical protein
MSGRLENQYGTITYCLKCVVQPEHASETWMYQAFRSSHCGNEIWTRYARGRLVLISSLFGLHKHDTKEVLRYDLHFVLEASYRSSYSVNWMPRLPRRALEYCFLLLRDATFRLPYWKDTRGWGSPPLRSTFSFPAELSESSWTVWGGFKDFQTLVISAAISLGCCLIEDLHGSK